MVGASSFPSQWFLCTPFAENLHSSISTCRNTHTHTCGAFTHRPTNVHTCSLSPLRTQARTNRRRPEENGGGEGRKEEKRRVSAGLLGSQLLRGCCLLLAMSCNCQFILSQPFHHCTQPGWRKPPESRRNLLATSH